MPTKPKGRGAQKRGPGRPPNAETPLPSPAYLRPDAATAYIGCTVATLWNGVRSGRITPPAYPSEKSPRFHIATLDADTERARARPSENEAGRRAAKLAEARARARALR